MRQELTCSQFVSELDSWVGRVVAIRVTAQSGVLLAVFHGVLRERSAEKHPAGLLAARPRRTDRADRPPRAPGCLPAPKRSRSRGRARRRKRPRASTRRGCAQPSRPLAVLEGSSRLASEADLRRPWLLRAHGRPSVATESPDPAAGRSSSIDSPRGLGLREAGKGPP
jgi:hypothetical protein